MGQQLLQPPYHLRTYLRTWAQQLAQQLPHPNCHLQDLLAATLEIPFSVPPYMSLLARSVATLEVGA